MGRLLDNAAWLHLASWYTSTADVPTKPCLGWGQGPAQYLQLRFCLCVHNAEMRCEVAAYGAARVALKARVLCADAGQGQLLAGVLLSSS